MDYEKYIKRCYSLAINAGKKGYDTFGAVLVYDGKILEEAENTSDYKRGLFGHAEFNLVHKCANKYSDEILSNSIFFTSCAPCERCLMAIASWGVKIVVYGVSYKSFSLLTLQDDIPLDREKILKQLNVDLKLIGPVLEDEGMRVFEYWGGEYYSLDTLIANIAEIKKCNRL